MIALIAIWYSCFAEGPTIHCIMMKVYSTCHIVSHIFSLYVAEKYQLILQSLADLSVCVC